MKKTLMKSLLLAAFALGTQNVSAQKVAVDDAVATNIRPNLSIGQKFYYEAIVYQITAANGSKYNVKAIGFYDGEVKEAVEIIGSGSANGADFVVDEIAALNSALTLSGTDFAAGDASKLAEIELIDFIADGGFEGTIAAGAFANLSGLTDIQVAAETPCEAEAGCFATAIQNNVKLSVPVSNLGTVAGKYATADGWKQMKRIYTQGDDFAYGDFDCSGSINTSDTAELAKYVKARGNYQGTYNAHSVDIDGSGKNNTSDTAELAKQIKARARKV